MPNDINLEKLDLGAVGGIDPPCLGDDELIKQKALKRIIKNNTIHFLKAKALSDLCIKPKTNEQYRIITTKQFNAFSLILHLLETEEIEEMYLAIYRINEPTVDSIIDFIESGKIKKALFIICSFFHATKVPERWALKLKDFCDKNTNCQHAYLNNHAKILAAKASGGGCYVFEGSGNLSDNGRIEQYVYENNEEVYCFHKTWMEELVYAKRHQP